MIVACDVGLKRLEEIVRVTSDMDEVLGYKIGFYLALKEGLGKTVDLIREYSSKTIIYDHQKAATDVPHTASLFCEACKEAGVDKVIFFPQSGPLVQKTWIEEAKRRYLEVIVGGLMSHPNYLKSEGGYLCDEAVERIYSYAYELGVREFVIPATKSFSPPFKATFYVVGLGKQGGVKPDFPHIPIVGRSVYGADDVREAVKRILHDTHF